MKLIKTELSHSTITTVIPKRQTVPNHGSYLYVTLTDLSNISILTSYAIHHITPIH